MRARRFREEITPGNAMMSLMTSKMRGLGPGARMPPVATDVVDDAAMAVIDEWINGLTTCQ
jgi:hypothetical protein